VSYQVKEIFYTLQGEGANAGRPAVLPHIIQHFAEKTAALT
jgi:hypothetical protein